MESTQKTAEIDESQSAEIARKEGKEMFEGYRFRRTFGFRLPPKYQIDGSADAGVTSMLLAMSREAEGWSRIAHAISNELIESVRQGEDASAYAAKRAFYEQARERCYYSHNLLMQAARLAARCGFSRPEAVPGLVLVWDEEEKKRNKQLNKKAEAQPESVRA